VIHIFTAIGIIYVTITCIGATIAIGVRLWEEVLRDLFKRDED